MSCEMCGRSSCSKSFHSHEEQQAFDEFANSVKDRMRGVLITKINRMLPEEIDDKLYIPLNEVLSIIDDYN